MLDGSSRKLENAADDTSSKLGSSTDRSQLVELRDTTEDYLGCWRCIRWLAGPPLGPRSIHSCLSGSLPLPIAAF